MSYQSASSVLVCKHGNLTEASLRSIFIPSCLITVHSSDTFSVVFFSSLTLNIIRRVSLRRCQLEVYTASTPKQAILANPERLLAAKSAFEMPSPPHCPSLWISLRRQNHSWFSLDSSGTTLKKPEYSPKGGQKCSLLSC